ncbi:MAG: hemagglutinin repeat-containing protein, partial [Rickettsiales bacterium]|nr:hemagglutinin repeat-containing protein [Rickettsiales bacterium]
MSKNYLSSDEVHHTGCRKLVSSLLCWSLILNNVLLVPPTRAAHSIVPSDESETRVYDLEDGDGGSVTIIDIAKPGPYGVSLNTFKIFQSHEKDGKIVVNNSLLAAVTRSGRAMTSNPQLKEREALVIVNELLGSGSELRISGSLEPIGGEDELIFFSGSNNLVLSGFEVIAGRKLTFVVGGHINTDETTGTVHFNLAKTNFLSLLDGYGNDEKKREIEARLDEKRARLDGEEKIRREMEEKGGEVEKISEKEEEIKKLRKEIEEEIENIGPESRAFSASCILASPIQLMGRKIAIAGDVALPGNELLLMVANDVGDRRSDGHYILRSDSVPDEDELISITSLGNIRAERLGVHIQTLGGRLSANGVTLATRTGIDIESIGNLVLSNRAGITSQGTLVANIGGSLITNLATICSLGDMELKIARELTNNNRSIITTANGDGTMIIRVGSKFINTGASIISAGTAGGSITVADGSMDNTGVLGELNKLGAVNHPYQQWQQEWTVVESIDRIKVHSSMEPSKIMAKGNFDIKVNGDICNEGSCIISETGTLLLEARSLTNERGGFTVNASYNLHKHYQSTHKEMMITGSYLWIIPKIGYHTVYDNNHLYGTAHHDEFYYSSTPSTIFGKNVILKLSGGLHQDDRKRHAGGGEDSSIGATRSLRIEAKEIYNGGTIFALLSKPIIETREDYFNIGGKIVFGNPGGRVKAKKFVSRALVNSFDLTADMYKSRDCPTTPTPTPKLYSSANTMLMWDPTPKLYSSANTMLTWEAIRCSNYGKATAHFEEMVQPSYIVQLKELDRPLLIQFGIPADQIPTVPPPSVPVEYVGYDKMEISASEGVEGVILDPDYGKFVIDAEVDIEGTSIQISDTLRLISKNIKITSQEISNRISSTATNTEFKVSSTENIASDVSVGRLEMVSPGGRVLFKGIKLKAGETNVEGNPEINIEGARNVLDSFYKHTDEESSLLIGYSEGKFYAGLRERTTTTINRNHRIAILKSNVDFGTLSGNLGDMNLESSDVSVKEAKNLNIKNINLKADAEEQIDSSETETITKDLTIGITNNAIASGYRMKHLNEKREQLVSADKRRKELEKLEKKGLATREAIDDATKNQVALALEVAEMSLLLGLDVADIGASMTATLGFGFPTFDTTITQEIEKHSIQKKHHVQSTLNLGKVTDSRVSGNLYIKGGKLTIDGGTLPVDGDLHIESVQDSCSQIDSHTTERDSISVGYGGGKKPPIKSAGLSISSSDSEQDVQWQQSQESGISGEGTLKAGGKLHMKGNVVVDIAELEANLLTFEEVIDKFHNITTGSSFG